ncbi:Remorin, C-terminal [Artemisia annua]|uniref:Remorin, C-terminal n=1 Tax=Artemisia annua TaxID=35608 RepID=A0A2U1LGI6_ARTAN|nr:Remorin, C-terminal [Artemisia annua]
MDFKNSKYIQPSHVGVKKKGNPFVESSSSRNLDPLSKLNLKETSEFVKSFPKRNVVDAPSTPGRPVFSFSVTPKVPSKWNDAEKWLVSDHDQTQNNHLHGFVKSADFVSRKSSSSNTSSSSNGYGIKQQTKAVSDKKVEKASVYKDHHNHKLAAASDSFDVLKDKFTNEVEPKFMKFECLEPLSESFLFKEASLEVKSRDIGTEMTPLGSSTTSRCPTPFKAFSPPRHNTPASRSGPIVVMDSNTSLNIGELQECHLAKMKLEIPFDSGVSNWSSREEEEEEISKSLRHFEMSNECRKSISESRACAWEEEEKTKCCLRYQREEAKIQAWVDLQNAKAEAQSRRLEVKIQKMRSKFEEKVMRKMAIVHRKAEELRTAAQLEHTEQMQKATEQANKTMNQHISMHYSGQSGSCCCFPCTNSLHH